MLHHSRCKAAIAPGLLLLLACNAIAARPSSWRRPSGRSTKYKGVGLRLGSLPTGQGFALGPQFTRRGLLKGQMTFRTSAAGTLSPRPICSTRRPASRSWQTTVSTSTPSQCSGTHRRWTITVRSRTRVAVRSIVAEKDKNGRGRQDAGEKHRSYFSF